MFTYFTWIILGNWVIAGNIPEKAVTGSLRIYILNFARHSYLIVNYEFLVTVFLKS